MGRDLFQPRSDRAFAPDSDAEINKNVFSTVPRIEKLGEFFTNEINLEKRPGILSRKISTPVLVEQIYPIIHKDDRWTSIVGMKEKMIQTMQAQIVTLQMKVDEKQNSKNTDIPFMNAKDFDKPSKYDGKSWLQWSTDFKTFLGHKDARWTAQPAPRTRPLVETDELLAVGSRGLAHPHP